MGDRTAGPVRVGLVGYGFAGRDIHTPLLREAGLDVVRVATSDPTRREQALADWPAARCVPDLAALLDDTVGGGAVEVVVLASPTAAHVEQAIACLDARLPVVVDKPLGVDAAEARRVVEHAERVGVPLTVFQNRRWDAEQLTLQRLLADGELGELYRFERRWERWRPTPKDRWRERNLPSEGGGLLLDLHSHLVDSAVQLFGPVHEVYAELAARTTVADDDAFLALRHENGMRSHLGALAVAGAPGPRTRVLGSAGSYLVTSFEAEPTAFEEYADPDDAHCGWLVAGSTRRPVRRAPGGAADFYRAVAAAVRESAPVPVDPRDALHVMAVLDAARVSDAERTVVRL